MTGFTVRHFGKKIVTGLDWMEDVESGGGGEDVESKHLLKHGKHKVK